MSTYAAYGGSINTEGAGKITQFLFRAGYASGFAVTQRGAGANMSVDVAAGGGLHNTSSSIPYFGWSDATENVTGFTADGSNPKRVIIVSYIDLSLITTVSTNNAGALKFKAVSGAAAASPSDPSDSDIQTAVGAGNPFNKLARIAVGAGATSVVNANITDLRVPMAYKVPYLYGGASNTNGHAVPNVADDTLALLNATQTLANKTLSNPTMPTGYPIQVVSTNYSAVATGTTQMPIDDTIPQITEGTEFMTQTITPKSASNILVIEASIALATNASAGTNCGAALFQDSTANAIAGQVFTSVGANYGTRVFLTHAMVAGTTSPTTFRVRVGPGAAWTITFNGINTTRLFGGITTSQIKITEYRA